ncbi:hypothetical protein V1514DRAFT_348528 [Lipomyces japonicus]|uniref:uncharacterized protein n=1 Tax=Lipomyces japonicus TaxID=56871 RepID=UPI0034CFBDEA
MFLKPTDGFEFSLFSTASKKIKIEEPGGGNELEIPTFANVDNKRPDSYYLVDDSDTTRRRQLEASAISGEDLLAQASTPWPGMAMPWKVIHIPSKQPPTKRNKPSKKRREILRQRLEKKQKITQATSSFKNGKIFNWRFYRKQDWTAPKQKSNAKTQYDQVHKLPKHVKNF